jgi:3-oxoacyl-[acyl-carrier-protein] synthase-3
MLEPIRITEIAYAAPESHLTAADLQEQFGLEPAFVAEKLGVSTLPRLQPPGPHAMRDLSLDAVAKLESAWVKDREVDCLVVCTQNPDGGGIPHMSAVLHGEMKLPESCAAWDVSLGCSGYVYCLWMVAAWMRQTASRRALVVTCDLYSRTLDPDDKATATLFGDAASVTCLEAGPGAGFELGDAEFASDGALRHVLSNESGRLRMNGREVFNFAIRKVPAQIEQLLAKAGLSPDEVDRWIFHQGSKFIVDSLGQRMRIDPNKVPIRLAEFGNTVSSSIPMVLQNLVHDVTVRRVVISGFGVGLSWASGLLERAQE